MGDVDIPVFRGIYMGILPLMLVSNKIMAPLWNVLVEVRLYCRNYVLDKPVIKEAHSNKCSDIRQRRCSKIVALLDFILILVCRPFLDSKFHDVIDK